MITDWTIPQILSAVREQLALDLNCRADDFLDPGMRFTQAVENPGRRPFPREARHFEMATMGHAVIVSASSDLLPYVEGELKGKSRDEAFSAAFVYGQSLYFLPDPRRITPLPVPSDVRLECIERAQLPALYAHKGFENALSYDTAHPRPDALAVVARIGHTVAAVAGASDDCQMLWQIGVDTREEYRGMGLAQAAVSRLAYEILRLGKIPYYGTSTSNTASQRVAYKSGFMPGWTSIYRGRFEGGMTPPCG